MFLRSESTRRYDLTSVEAKRNPFPVWRTMRNDGPLVPSKIMILGKCRMATTWQAVNDVLRDQELFVRNPAKMGNSSVGLRWWIPRQFRLLANNMLAQDHEDHRRLRSLVDQAFRTASVDSLRPKMESLTSRLLDDLESKAAASHERSVDFVEHFARPFPLAVIVELLGLPDEDRSKFTNWFHAMSDVRSVFGIFKMLPGIRKILKYLDRQFTDARKSPRPGLIGELVRIELNGDRLSKDELVSMVFLLLAAGHETTVHLLSNGVVAFLEHPKQLEMLKTQTASWETAVDEVLRFASPVQISKPRSVTRDVEFHGATLKKGDMVIGVLASANSDPEKFEDPESFDVRRSPNPHLSFGTGVHVCLGLKLAKAEAELAFQRFFERFPNVQIASNHGVEWGRRIGVRAIKRLRLELDR